MSDFSSLPSLPYKKYYAPKKLKGGDSSSDAAIIAIVVVIIVILVVAIIMAACWGCGSQTETVYVTGPNGQPTAVTMSKKKARAYKKSRAALKELPPLTPHRKGGKTYELGSGGGKARVHDLQSEADARALLHGGQPVALFVHMNGCGFCDKAKAYFNDAYAQEHPAVVLAQIEASKCRQLCQEHGITGFPTFLTNFGGQGVQKHVGYKPKEVMSSLLAAAAHGGARYSRMQTGGGGGGVVHEVEDADQARAMMQGGDKVVLFLYMPWCGYCKKQKPVLDELAAKLKHIKFAAINAEKGGRKIADAMGMTGFPAFLTNFTKGGALAAGAGPQKHVGYKDAQTFQREVLGM